MLEEHGEGRGLLIYVNEVISILDAAADSQLPGDLTKTTGCTNLNDAGPLRNYNSCPDVQEQCPAQVQYLEVDVYVEVPRYTMMSVAGSTSTGFCQKEK